MRAARRYAASEDAWRYEALIRQAEMLSRYFGNMGDQVDRMEMELLDLALERRLPVFGICRGMQLINVALGGGLIQDLPPEQKRFHAGVKSDAVHPVAALEGSLLHRLYGPVFPVNSSHHQAVDRLGEGLRAAAWAESGFAEAIDLPGYPLLGVQFHPERMSFGKRRLDTIDGAAIFSWFLALCQGGELDGGWKG